MNSKHSYLFFLIIFFGISCSNKPSDEKVRSLIADYEKQEMIKYQNVLALPCSPFKAIKIPKHFKSAYFPTDDVLSKTFQQQKDVLDGFSLSNLISLTAGQEFSGLNNDGKQLSTKEYDVNLKQEGDKIKIGETADEYVLPLFDINNATILKENSLSKDTLLVYYKLLELPTYQVLKQKCTYNESNYLPKSDSSTIVIVKDGNDWKRRD